MTARHPLAQVFEHWGRVETGGTSPLYALLCEVIAADPDLLALAAHTRPGHPAPNMLFGAVHLLLTRQPRARLAAWYPDLAGERVRSDDPGPAFCAFCVEHKDELARLLAEKRVQTNEVQRCLLLLPAFHLVAREAGRPLALLEIGPSAGLLLNFDRYGYAYRRGAEVARAGGPRAGVSLETELEGPGRPPLDPDPVRVAWRCGLDLNPLDATSPEVREWLLALVWPEHDERRARLAAALDLAAAHPPDLRAGDAVTALPALLSEVPAEAALLVFHMNVLQQVSKDGRAALDATLKAASAARDLWRLGNDLHPPVGERLPLTLCRYHRGEREDVLLAEAPGHVRWLRWEIAT